MARNLYKNEDDVKELLGIDDFRQVSKDRIINFVSNLPRMDKEVAIKCVEQFPSFAEFANNAVGHYMDSIKDLSECNDGSPVDAYKVAIDNLDYQLKNNPSLSISEQRDMINQIVEIGEKIEVVHKEHINLKKFAIMAVSTVATVAVGVAGALIGVNSNIKIPFNKR